MIGWLPAWVVVVVVLVLVAWWLYRSRTDLLLGVWTDPSGADEGGVSSIYFKPDGRGSIVFNNSPVAFVWHRAGSFFSRDLVDITLSSDGVLETLNIRAIADVNELDIISVHTGAPFAHLYRDAYASVLVEDIAAKVT